MKSFNRVEQEDGTVCYVQKGCVVNMKYKLSDKVYMKCNGVTISTRDLQRAKADILGTSYVWARIRLFFKGIPERLSFHFNPFAVYVTDKRWCKKYLRNTKLFIIDLTHGADTAKVSAVWFGVTIIEPIKRNYA